MEMNLVQTIHEEELVILRLGFVNVIRDSTEEAANINQSALSNCITHNTSRDSYEEN